MDQQLVEGLYLDVFELLDLWPDELDPLLGTEERRAALAGRFVDHRDDDPVEHARRPLDDVEVPEGDRVVGARAHGNAALEVSHDGSVSACRRSRVRTRAAARAPAGRACPIRSR